MDDSIQPALAVGSHLITPRLEFAGQRLYDHHGIYVGANIVIHYAGMAQFLCKGPVQETMIDDFLSGHGCVLEKHIASRYSGTEAAERARSRLGETAYDVAFNNCEHFVNWCIEGSAVSHQVERVVLRGKRLAMITNPSLVATDWIIRRLKISDVENG